MRGDQPKNRTVKRKSKQFFQSKQKRIRVLESDSDIEFLPNEESFVDDIETSDDTMEVMDNSTSKNLFVHQKQTNKCITASFSSTSTPIINRFCKKSGLNSSSCAHDIQSNLSKFSCLSNVSQNSEANSIAESRNPQNTQYLHENQTWLLPTQLKDNEGRKPDDPNYNPKSLYVPPKFLATVTPAQKQWWEFKSQNFDAILVFKVTFVKILYMTCVQSFTCINYNIR